MDQTQHCRRCDRDLPQDQWYASTWGKSGQWCKDCYREWHRQRYAAKADDSPRDCAWCGESYRPKARTKSEFCSRKCKEQARNAAVSAATIQAKPDRECLHCGRSLPRSMRADAVFCSQKCNNAAHALQRKLRARTGEDEKPGYLRAAICKRDKWRCGICGDRVNPSLEHPHPRAASLDHVIPVSEGGTNEPANLRLVHLVCNLRRRNLGGGEQLALM